MLYRTHTTTPGISTMAYLIPGYGYESLTDLTELSGMGMKVIQNNRVRI